MPITHKNVGTRYVLMANGESNSPTDTGGGSSILPNFIAKSFVRKFVITLLLVLIVVGGVSAFAYAQTTQQLTADAEAEYTSEAERNAEDISEWQSERVSNVESSSQFELLQEGEDDAINTFAEDELERLPDDVTDVHIVDLNDREITHSSEDARQETQINIREAPWAWDGSAAEAAENGETYVSEVIEIHGEPAVAYVSPIGDEDEYDGQVLVFMSSMDGVVDGFTSPADGAFTQVINSDSDVIAGEIGQTELQRNLGSFEPYTTDEDGNDLRPDFLDRALAGETGFLETTEKRGLDEDHVTAYAPVVSDDDEIELAVAVHVPTAEAFALQSDITTSMLAIVLATFVGLGFMAVAFGRGTVRSINELSTKAQALENGNLDEEFEVKRTDEIGKLFQAFGSMRDALREQIQEAEDARLQAEEAKAEAEQMNQHLETKADEYSAVMQEAAAGDLTRRMDAESESEAMADIATEFNEMLTEIETTVEELKTFAMEVATSSEEVTASSEEVRSASQQVTESVQEISDGAERQNTALQSANSQLGDLSTSVEQVAETSTEVADIAEKTAETGRDGQLAAQEALEGMNQIEEESEETVEAMNQLQGEIQQIDELLEFITEIASQTNMLALNANIEASRSVSGDESEGFGVVAQEIKELASETKDAAQNIEKRLEQIKTETDRTANEVRTTREQISKQTDEVREAADALEEIADYAQETNTGVQEIETATQEQADATQQVVSIVEETATISEQTTSESENVAAAAEEQTTALTEMSRSAGDLSSRASQLSTALDRFATDADDDADSVLTADEAEPVDDADPIVDAGDTLVTDAEPVLDATGEADADGESDSQDDAIENIVKEIEAEDAGAVADEPDQGSAQWDESTAESQWDDAESSAGGDQPPQEETATDDQPVGATEDEMFSFSQSESESKLDDD